MQGYSFVAPSVIFSENAISDAIFESNGAQSKQKPVNPGVNLASVFQDDKRPGDISLIDRIKSPFTEKYELLHEDGFLGESGDCLSC